MVMWQWAKHRSLIESMNMHSKILHLLEITLAYAMGLCFHSNSRLMVEFTFLVRGYIMHKKYLFSLVAFCSFAVFQSYFIKARVIGKGPDYISRIQRFQCLYSLWNTVIFRCWNYELYLDEWLAIAYFISKIVDWYISSRPSNMKFIAHV